MIKNRKSHHGFARSIVGVVIISACGLLAVSGAKAATSVSQFGITWNFDSDHVVGQFANGDWWVVGPVTITSITPFDNLPNDGIDMHGTVINPVVNTATQGWDSRVSDTGYDPSKNIAKVLPYTAAAGTSILSAESIAGPVTNKRQLQTIAILTVLAEEPAVGSFRPPYVGTDKTIRWNKSNLNYGVFRSLAPVANTPSISTVEAWFEKPLIEIKSGWTSRYLRPVSNSPDYGREISLQVGKAGLMLNLNFTNQQKETLLVRFVQRGIDIYGAAQGGHTWDANGGHCQGRKLPLLIAAEALGDSDMMKWADHQLHPIFQEDQQTFYVSQADVNRARLSPNGRIREPYTVDMIGTPEWGITHTSKPGQDGSQWDVEYRLVCGPAMIPNVLTARIMGLEQKWNWPVLFDYYDRLWSVESVRARDKSNYINLFERNMWVSYRGSAGVPTEVGPTVDVPETGGDGPDDDIPSDGE
jgi:hypothetical protein